LTNTHNYSDKHNAVALHAECACSSANDIKNLHLHISQMTADYYQMSHYILISLLHLLTCLIFQQLFSLLQTF